MGPNALKPIYVLVFVFVFVFFLFSSKNPQVRKRIPVASQAGSQLASQPASSLVGQPTNPMKLFKNKGVAKALTHMCCKQKRKKTKKKKNKEKQRT